VIYTAQARSGLLGLGPEQLAGIRSASEPYALLLARTARDRLGATWGLGETGAAGPSGNRYGDAPGHSCIAVTGPVERVLTLETGAANREANMWAFAEAALGLLRECLAGPG
jgi:nicotinamide mononucleotide (NMN) deamidase PncC